MFVLLKGEWSPCSAACGGRQVRGVICIGGNGRRLRDASCRAPRPEAQRECGGECVPSWYLSDWSEVSLHLIVKDKHIPGVVRFTVSSSVKKVNIVLMK